MYILCCLLLLLQVISGILLSKFELVATISITKNMQIYIQVCMQSFMHCLQGNSKYMQMFMLMFMLMFMPK
jgi:hypothetical protein